MVNMSEYNVENSGSDDAGVTRTQHRVALQDFIDATANVAIYDRMTRYRSEELNIKLTRTIRHAMDIGIPVDTLREEWVRIQDKAGSYAGIVMYGHPSEEGNEW